MAGTGVGKFSSTAGSNTGNMTVNFAENMAPSNVNNAARELMGHMRDMYEQLGDGYFEFGDGDGVYTIARVDADTLTIATAADLSTTYFAGRKIRVTDGGANVVEGTITSTSHGSSLQTVNLTGISLASGTPTKVEIGIDTAAFGGKLILDDDGDTFIEAPTDDTIDIHIAGAKDFVFTANTFTAESGSTIAAQALTATSITSTGNIIIPNAGNIGSAGDTDSIAIASDGVVTLTQKLIGTELDISGNVDVDGTTNLDVVDIDGAVNMATTALVTGVLTTTAATVFNGGFASNGASSIGGTTPTLTIGDAGAEDAKIIFDGNAQDFHIGLDDSGDKLTIGLGSTLGTTPGFTMDENTNVVFPDNSVTIISSGNGNNLILISTDADADVGPILKFARDSGSPADGDTLGSLDFFADNSNGDSEKFADIFCVLADISDGTEDAKLQMRTVVDGTMRQRFSINESETVLNDDSVDIDFRVESNGATHALFVEGSTNAVMSGHSTASVLDTGFEFRNTGIFGATADSQTVGFLNRLGNDGEILKFFQASAQEGSINISGSTTQYLAFTGSHWSRLADNSKPTILRGTVMESLDTMMDWYQAVAEVAETTDETGQVIPARQIKQSIALGDKSVGDAITFTSDTISGDGKEHTGTIVKEDDVKHVHCKISDTADSKRIYGVFSNWDDVDDTVNDMNIAQVGTYIIRVHKDVTVAGGDLLVSNGDGTAKLQDDDIIRSKTVAKVNSNVKVETYADGSYTVPCTLHC